MDDLMLNNSAYGLYMELASHLKRYKHTYEETQMKRKQNTTIESMHTVMKRCVWLVFAWVKRT